MTVCPPAFGIYIESKSGSYSMFFSVLQRGEACHAAEEPTEETLGRDIQVIGYLLHREVGISQHHLYLCHHHIVNKFLGRTATHLLDSILTPLIRGAGNHPYPMHRSSHTPLHGASL